ncbi:hypothetical protein PSTG_12000 [Puccinia striiformis f. sp. tritici PST-78]|uniref:Uncharacterized protein n=1 Tax=Puccinia striiformis f. sp. tritici PST-78 TaxID=1165861 RepID=A0A0L0V5T4_9BASI|nr:hypothetical protein PSTG_12000 [Puccinia striiformis f. sp. tritici PST-78]
MSSSNQKTSAPQLPVLKPPGPETNYLDWEMVVEAYFRHVKVKHVLDTSDIKLARQPGPTTTTSSAPPSCKSLTRQTIATKLLIACMEGDDINSHIDTMAKYHERLNSLVTPDDVHTATILGSIPKDWVGCVSNLMNQDGNHCIGPQEQVNLFVDMERGFESLTPSRHGPYASTSQNQQPNFKLHPPPPIRKTQADLFGKHRDTSDQD